MVARSRVVAAPGASRFRSRICRASQRPTERRRPFVSSAEEVSRPFDLATGPPLPGGAPAARRRRPRAVARLPSHRRGRLVRAASSCGRSPLSTARAWVPASTLPALGVQYLDFTSWQRERLQGEWLAEQAGYWRKTTRQPAHPGASGRSPQAADPDLPRLQRAGLDSRRARARAARHRASASGPRCS